MGNEVVRVLENIPVVNLGVALGHAINGDEEAAQRAALRGTFNAITMGITAPSNIAGDVIAENKKQEILDKLNGLPSSFQRESKIKESDYKMDQVKNVQLSQVYSCIQTLPQNNKYKSFTKGFAQFTLSTVKAMHGLTTSLKESLQLDVREFQQRVEGIYELSQQLERCTEQALNKYEGIKSSLSSEISTTRAQIDGLVSQYNDKVTAINDAYEQIEKNVRNAKSELNSAGAGRFLPVGGSIVEACTIDQCFTILSNTKNIISENEGTIQTLSGKKSDLRQLSSEYQAFVALGEAFKNWDLITQKVAIQMITLKDKALSTKISANDNNGNEFEFLVKICVQKCKDDYIPDMLKIVEDGMKSNADYLQQMQRLQDLEVNAWKTSIVNGLIYLD